MLANPEKLAVLNRRFTTVLNDLVSASPSADSTLNTLNDIFNPWRKDFSDEFTDLDVFHKLVVTLEALVAFRKTRNVLSVMKADHLQQEMLDMVSTVAELLPRHLLDDKTDDFSELQELLLAVRDIPAVSRYHTLEFLCENYAHHINSLLTGKQLSLTELLISNHLNPQDLVNTIEKLRNKVTFLSILSSGALVGGLLQHARELQADSPKVLIASPDVDSTGVVFQNPKFQLNAMVLVDDKRSRTNTAATKVYQALKGRFGDQALVLNP